MERRSLLGSEFALAMVVLVWGVNFPILKAVLAVMHPHTVNALRYVVSALVIGIIYHVEVRRLGLSFFEPLRERGVQIVLLALLGYVLYQLAFILGLDRTTAGNAALIMASAPLWTAVTGFIFRTEALRIKSWAGLVLSLLGTLVVVTGGEGGIAIGGGSLVGNLFVLAASVCWGSFTAFSKPVSKSLSPLAVTFFGLMVAVPLLGGVAIIYAEPIDWDLITPAVWAAILFSGGLSTGLAYVVWNIAVRQAGASQTAVWGNLVPLTAVAASALLLGETITALQITGGALILGGLFVMRVR
jgi:drug/metabolite transporter (DMT)-like permease